MGSWKCILWASTAAPLCRCPLPVRRRFRKGGQWRLPLPGLGCREFTWACCPSSRKLEMFGVSSASALCVLVTHQAGTRPGLSLPWAVDTEAASPFSQEQVVFYRWWAQGLSPAVEQGPASVGGSSLLAGWENGTGFRVLSRGREGQGLCRSVPLARTTS